MRKTDRRYWSYHEAGHAVLAAALIDMPRIVTISRRGPIAGHTGYMALFCEPTKLVQVTLAGEAATQLLTGRIPEYFTMFDEPGLGRLRNSLANPNNSAMDPTFAFRVLKNNFKGLRAQVKQYVRCYAMSLDCLRSVWPLVDRVARALMAQTTLNRSDLLDLIGDTDIYSPVFAVQAAHDDSKHDQLRVSAIGGRVPARVTKRTRVR